MFCNMCGTPCDNNAHFCPNCGVLINKQPIQLTIEKIDKKKRVKNAILTTICTILTIFTSVVFLLAMVVSAMFPFSGLDGSGEISVTPLIIFAVAAVAGIILNAIGIKSKCSNGQRAAHIIFTAFLCGELLFILLILSGWLLIYQGLL